MRYLALALIIVASVSSALGCRKSKRTEPASPGPTADPAPSVPPSETRAHSLQVQGPSAVVPALTPSKIDPVVEFMASSEFRDLSTGLQLFEDRFKRMPTDIAELHRSGCVSAIPQAPAGKSLQIDRAAKRVVLR